LQLQNQHLEQLQQLHRDARKLLQDELHMADNKLQHVIELRNFMEEVGAGNENYPSLYGGSTLVKSLCTVTPDCDSVDGTCDHVTYQKLVTQ
jgi:hypothetical protein